MTRAAGATCCREWRRRPAVGARRTASSGWPTSVRYAPGPGEGRELDFLLSLMNQFPPRRGKARIRGSGLKRPRSSRHTTQTPVNRLNLPVAGGSLMLVSWCSLASDGHEINSCLTAFRCTISDGAASVPNRERPGRPAPGTGAIAVPRPGSQATAERRAAGEAGLLPGTASGSAGRFRNQERLTWRTSPVRGSLMCT